VKDDDNILYKLELSSIKLNDISVNHLISFIKEKKDLVELDLSWNGLTSVSIVGLC
jgi:Leucine-rich repeat (LRR) protein